MNTALKFIPWSYRLILPVVYRRSAKVFTKNHKLEFNRISQGTLLMTVGLAGFLWPVKKMKSEQNCTINEKALSQTSNLATADNLFETGRYEECYNYLVTLENKDDVEIVWRICRVMYNKAKESKDTDEKRNLILKAYDIIFSRLETSRDNFAVQKWYAILLDAKSNYDGIKERIKQLENVKKHMDLAVALNPNDATTLYMLGEWCYQVSELPWYHRKIAETLFASPPRSSYEDALEYFLRAESVQPRFYSLNLLRLGKCYIKLQKEDQAKYYLQLAASYPAKTNDDHQANTEAADLLKKLK